MSNYKYKGLNLLIQKPRVLPNQKHSEYLEDVPKWKIPYLTSQEGLPSHTEIAV